jgi:hypothetical protein
MADARKLLAEQIGLLFISNIELSAALAQAKAHVDALTPAPEAPPAAEAGVPVPSMGQNG